MDDDDEYEEDDAFSWGALHTLHTYAWNAACGRIKGVEIVLGLRLIDAIKAEEIDEKSAPAYVDVFADAANRGGAVRWT